MADSPYSQKRSYQFRGPQKSDDYNAMTEEHYNDLVYLYNKLGLQEEDIRLLNQRGVKELLSISGSISNLENRLTGLEASSGKLVFTGGNQIDNDRFTSTPYELSSTTRNTFTSQYSILTLPRVESSSFSKLCFFNTDGNPTIPSSLETFVEGVGDSADSVAATLNTSQPFNAILTQAGHIWERNVLVDTPDTDGAVMYLYVRLPSDLSFSANSNNILVHPFPMKGVDLLEVAYTTKADPALNGAESFTPVNATGINASDPNAVGWSPPGGWPGDEILNCGPKSFYFGDASVSAVRLKLRQRNYYFENSKYIYTYGLSKLDVRLDKFLDTGKSMIRFDVPNNVTLSAVTSVLPQIWNVSPAELNDVFTYRVIWETSFNSGVYTTSPVALSKRAWIEVTLAKTLNGSTPALSGLVVSYT